MNMSSIKHVATKLFATLALATALVIACAGSAFAANISVTVPTTSGTTITSTVDTTTDLVYTTSSTVYGQYYKTGWNYLASNYYVTFDDMIQAAVDNYNDYHGTSYVLSSTWSTMSLSTSDLDPYTKYNPTRNDIDNCVYVFEGSTTHTNSYACFAFKWGKGTSMSSALSACNASSIQAYPRLIMGISSFDSAVAAGKRYPSDITAITLS